MIPMGKNSFQSPAFGSLVYMEPGIYTVPIKQEIDASAREAEQVDDI
jgi:hypothetical protein